MAGGVTTGSGRSRAEQRDGLLAAAEWGVCRPRAIFARRSHGLRDSIRILIDGEPYYNLGLALRLQGKGREAYSAFYKATWNAAWRGPAYHALAESAASHGDWITALDHLERALRCDADSLNSRNLKVMVLRKLGRSEEAGTLLKETRALDRLDTWSRYLESGEPPADGQQILDLSFDLARSGFNMDALDVLCHADPTRKDGSGPMVLYLKANLYAKLGETGRSVDTYRQASVADVLYCFPSRLEEMLTLELAIAANPDDARAPYLLGNMLYDRRRHEEAITQWKAAAERDPEFPTVWRNLGIAYFNVRGDARQSARCLRPRSCCRSSGCPHSL